MSNFELLRMMLRNDDDAVGLRHVAARTARLVHLDAADVTKVATSVSELGRLAQDYLPAELIIAVGSRPNGQPGLLVIELVFRADRMPPFAHTIDAARPASAAAALTAVGRLMDQTEIAADRIVISKLLVTDLEPDEPARLRDQLLIEPPGDLRAALRSQNEELVATLVALRERESELVRVNSELEQTNRGVVALYAQLEERAAEVRAAQRIVFEELEGALRPPAPTVTGLEFDIRYLPAQVNSPTGGDLYDWLVLPDGTVHITIVDVEGHGVQSTRDALLVTHAVRTLTLEGHLPGQILTRTDELLRASKDNVRATALIARLDPRTGVLHLAGAGHPLALRLPAAGEPEFLAAPGRPLGYIEGGSSHLATFQLAPDDCVLLYTDGLVEVRHDIIEGLDTLAAAAVKGRGLPIPQLLDTVLAACTQGDLLEDDTLLLAMRWRPVG